MLKSQSAGAGRIVGLKLALLALLLTCASTTKASAIFTENFNGYPGTANLQPGGQVLATIGAVTPIPGTQFTVTAGTIDILGGFSNLSMGACNTPTDKCLDIYGSSFGTITSIPSFTLTAGNVYTLTMDIAGPGPVGGNSISSLITLGLQSTTFTVLAANKATGFHPFQWQFVANTTQSGVHLVIQSLTFEPAGPSGSFIDNITLLESAPTTGVPEPATALVGVPLAALILWKSRRHQPDH